MFRILDQSTQSAKRRICDPNVGAEKTNTAAVQRLRESHLEGRGSESFICAGTRVRPTYYCYRTGGGPRSRIDTLKPSPRATATLWFYLATRIKLIHIVLPSCYSPYHRQPSDENSSDRNVVVGVEILSLVGAACQLVFEECEHDGCPRSIILIL